MSPWRRRCSIAAQSDFQCGYTPDEIANARKLRRQSRLGRDDARHRRGDRRAQGRRPGRHHRLLHGRQRRLPRGGRLNGLSASVAYYGGRIAKFADEKPKCPMQMHFGETDPRIPMTDVETIKQKRPTARSSSIRAPATASIATSAAASTRRAAKLAWERSMEFLSQAHEEVGRPHSSEFTSIVMAGLVPAIHVLFYWTED